jgi:RNA polymerase sigma factor (sigma-70 family)
MNDATSRPPNDADLVAAHLRGDRAALAGIYDRYADALHDTAAAMLRDRHEAADVVQDVFLVGAERLGQLRDPSRLKPWLFAILRNEVYRRSRRRRRAVPTDFAAPEVAEVAAPTDPTADGEALAGAELAELVRGAAAGLDERDQLVLELSVRQGLAGADLADALGVTPDQGYVLVHRMRERVERSIGALTVARMGRRDCPELADVLRGWDGTFSVLIRKRVARHVDRCDTCERTKRRFAVIPLVGAAPALAAPPELRERVLGRVGTAGAAPTVPYGFADRDGFPSPPGGARRRAAVVAAVVVALVVLIGGGVTLVARGGEASPATAPSSTADATAVPSTDAGGSAATSTTAPSDPSSTPGSTPGSAPGSSTTAPPPSEPTSSSTSPTTSPVVAPVGSAPPAAAPPAAPPPPPPAAPPAPPPTAPPVVTAPPPTTTTTAPPRPGRLDVSSTVVDLGPAAGSGAVTLTNSGEVPLDWTVAPTGAPGAFGASTSGGSLAPGASTPLSFTVDRAGRPEGDLAATFTVTSSATGGGQVQVRASVEIDPDVTITEAPSVAPCPTGTTSFVRAQVVDASPLASVVLSWSGAGPSGSTAMSPDGAGRWGAAFGGVGDGSWTFTVTATDARGNTGTAGGSTVVVGC